MPRRSAAPFLIGFAVVAVAALAGLWRVDMMRRDGRRAASTISTHLLLAQEGLDQLRAAQAGSIAAGQRSEEWLTRGTAALVQIESALAALAATSNATTARPHYDAATGHLAQITAGDKKARSFIAADQPLLAADALFIESGESQKMLALEISSARDAELAAFEAAATRLGYIDMGIAGAALLVGLVLLIMGTRASQVPAETTESLDVTDRPTAAASPRVDAPTTSADPFAAPSVDLSGVAELCVDLGRIVDGRDLPALMSRAAGVLEAKGLVLWVSEAGGTTLRPSLAHGYPERVLQRMGTLPVDGDNVTSLAFRTCQTQTLRSSVEGYGAIAVPLMTGSGCVGVLAAEMQGAKPGDARFDIARMIAAQLSTLVSPGAAAPPSKAAGLNS